jgi:hypothetical protein
MQSAVRRALRRTERERAMGLLFWNNKTHAYICQSILCKRGASLLPSSLFCMYAPAYTLTPGGSTSSSSSTHTHTYIQTAKPKRASERATSSSSSRRRIYTSTPSEYNTPLATRQDPLKVGLLGTERAPTLCVRARERESCLQMISWFLACDVNEKNMTQANSIFPRAPPPCVMLLLEPSRESCTLDSN